MNKQPETELWELLLFLLYLQFFLFVLCVLKKDIKRIKNQDKELNWKYHNHTIHDKRKSLISKVLCFYYKFI